MFGRLFPRKKSDVSTTYTATPRLRPSKLATMRITAVSSGQNSQLMGGACSCVETWTSESDFSHIRLIFMADVTHDSLAIGATAIAPNSRLTNNPIDGIGSPIPLTKVNFVSGGKAIKSQPEMAQTNAEAKALQIPRTLDLPTNKRALVPTLYCSDWTRLDSIDRVDGGPGRLIHIRTMTPAGSYMCGVSTTLGGKATAADPQIITGRNYRTCFMDGDVVTEETFVSETNSSHPPAQGRGFVYGIQIMTGRPGFTIQMVGDSIGSGYGGKTNNTSFVQVVAAILTSPDRPIHFLQSGTYGQSSLGYIEAAKNDLEIANVAISVIQTWSGNDVNAKMSGSEAQAAADAAWENAMIYGERVRKEGGIPIYLTAVPQHTKCVTADQEIARLSSVSRCNEISRKGDYIIDLNAILGDGGSPTLYQSRYAIDNLHPNQDGQERLVAEILPIIKSLLD